jgi:hypothetical protein
MGIAPGSLASTVVFARIRKVAAMWKINWAVIEPIAADY